MGLLDGLAEAAGREVHLAAVALGGVGAEPGLQEGGAVGGGCEFCFWVGEGLLGDGKGGGMGHVLQRSRTESVEADVLAGVDDGEFAREGQDGTFAVFFSPESQQKPCSPQAEVKIIERGEKIPSNTYLAVYANCGVALPTNATTLAVFTTLPRSFPNFRMLKTACLHPHHTPLTLMPMVKSQIRSSVSTASLSSACMMPALLNMTSTPPQESRWETAAATSASRETSQVRVSTRCVVEWREGKMEWTLVRAEEREGAEMSVIRTDAPSRRKRMVVSRPMPLEGG